MSDDFRAMVDAAAERLKSQFRAFSSNLSTQPDRDHHPKEQTSRHRRASESGKPTAAKDPAGSNPAPTAWKAALEVLPDELTNMPLPSNPLARALAEQPTVRELEWNMYRSQGSFKPRTMMDIASIMIYLSGKISADPCRNCRLMNGPYARCVVPSPAVLAQSSGLRHACANCTYQTQHRRCTNLPIENEELATKTRMAKSAFGIKNATPVKPVGRKPKSVTRNASAKFSTSNNSPTSKHRADFKDMIHKQSAAAKGSTSGTASFAEKLRQARSWSPYSRQQMNAEVMQWQAAIMTVEAENPTSTSSFNSPTLAGRQELEMNRLLPAPNFGRRQSGSVSMDMPSSLLPPTRPVPSVASSSVEEYQGEVSSQRIDEGDGQESDSCDRDGEGLRGLAVAI